MNRWIRVLLVVAATALSARAGHAQSFYGCSTFSCHSAVFAVSAIDPIQIYGYTYSRRVDITWSHDFGANRGFFRYGSYGWPMPVAPGFVLDQLWDAVGWNTPGTCLLEINATCTGTWSEWRAGYITDDWRVSAASVTVFDFAEALVPPGSDQIAAPGPAHVVDLRLVPEPSTWALSLGGLLLTGAWRRRRGRHGRI